jgi:hypothetical protein
MFSEYIVPRAFLIFCKVIHLCAAQFSSSSYGLWKVLFQFYDLLPVALVFCQIHYEWNLFMCSTKYTAA